jgi:hypothetical protein
MTRLILRLLNAPLLILLVAVGLAFQSSLFRTWPLLFFQPNVILPVVVWCALRRGFDEGGIITLIVANMGEIHSAAPSGVFLLSYMLVFLIVRVASRIFVIRSLFSFIMVALVSSIGQKLSSLAILYLLGVIGGQISGQGGGLWNSTLPFILFQAGIESLFSIWAFKAFEKFDWATFKNLRAEQVIDDELQLNNEGF